MPQGQRPSCTAFDQTKELVVTLKAARWLQARRAAGSSTSQRPHLHAARLTSHTVSRIAAGEVRQAVSEHETPEPGPHSLRKARLKHGFIS